MDIIPEEGSRFSKLITSSEGRLKRKLLVPLLYVDKDCGEIYVREGFVTDYASINSLNPMFSGWRGLLLKCCVGLLLWVLYLMLVGHGDKASTVHDYLYRSNRTKRLSRKNADKVFYNALIEEGVGEIRAKIFYYGVRVLGRYSFEKRS